MRAASKQTRAAPPVTAAQRRMLKRLADHNDSYQVAQARIDALWRRRVELYIAARALDPPLTFRQIAEVFGITEAAVMQMYARATKPDEASA